MAIFPLSVSTNDLTCLLADDNQAMLEALDCFLRSEGVEVVGLATSGIDALRLLETLPTKVIVVDFRLPDLDGIEVARRAREIVRKKTAVVLYTSYANRRLVTDALDVGARAVVLKDAPPTNLLRAIGAVTNGGIYIDPQLRFGPTGNGR